MKQLQRTVQFRAQSGEKDVPVCPFPSPSAADPGFAKGWTIPNTQSASPNGAPIAGSRGRAPGGGSGALKPLKLKAFCRFSCKNGAKS